MQNFPAYTVQCCITVVMPVASHASAANNERAVRYNNVLRTNVAKVYSSAVPVQGVILNTESNGQV